MGEMKINKNVETSDIKCDVYPKFVCIRVKKKLTQLRMFEEVLPDASSVKRSELTGELVITMRKKESDEMMRSLQKAEKAKKEKEEREKNEAEYEKKKKEDER